MPGELTRSYQGPDGGREIERPTHYVLVGDHGVFVKEAAFFEEQGGLREPWGSKWEPVEAANLYEARKIAIQMRRERFPDAHRTGGEGEPMEEAWPEARGL